MLITDNGSHYANALVKELRQAFRFMHRFTVAYAPWTNGQIERVNQPILRHIKTLTSEYGLTENEWPSLLGTIMHLLNNTPLKRRLDNTPNGLFLGHTQESNLMDENCERLYTEFIDRQKTSPKSVKKNRRPWKPSEKRVRLRKTTSIDTS